LLNLGDLLVGFFGFEVDVGELERVVDLLVVFVEAGVAIADHRVAEAQGCCGEFVRQLWIHLLNQASN
jgi:hypothetical protein